ncbi:RNA-guided pseudouridylation complex pseudouridine synthase subunit Cbf5 [Candidatus Micrarchaeota archaeon]|nr:RNA-guided pseudouridylation complex pseudouridine synthase subunit Cbf5 [Candidatus Micrarchaeota archaeon]
MVETVLDDRVVIIDKPPGMASHEVTTSVKKLTGVSRAGHAGTLDPEVTGVLPVALGKATKLLRYIAGKHKTYAGIIKFKNVLEKSRIQELFSEFTGEIIQTPPKISAVKKAPRKRHVHYLRLLEVRGRLALFEAKVDAGTYIRTLCMDIGKRCGGARMEELRRTAVGNITEKEAHTMQELADALWLYRKKNQKEMLEKMLRKPEELIGLPKAHIRESAIDSVLSGAQIMAPALEKMENVEKGHRVAIYCGKNFVGVGLAQVSSKELGKRGLAIKLERVHRSYH